MTLLRIECLADPSLSACGDLSGPPSGAGGNVGLTCFDLETLIGAVQYGRQPFDGPEVEDRLVDLLSGLDRDGPLAQPADLVDATVVAARARGDAEAFALGVDTMYAACVAHGYLGSS